VDEQVAMNDMNATILATIIRRPSEVSVGGGAVAGRSLSRYIAQRIPIDCAEMAERDEIVEWESNKYYYRSSYYGVPQFLRRSLPFLRARELNTFMFSRIPELIASKQYSIVHIHNLHPIWAVYQVAKACKREQVPYVIACHGVHEMAAQGRLKDGKHRGAKALAAYVGTGIPLRYVFQNSALVYASSPADYPVLEALGTELHKVRVVPNGVAPEILQQQSPEQLERLRAKYNLPTDKPLLVFVGHLRPKKGVDDLLKALTKVSAQFHLAVVGPHSFPELAQTLKAFTQSAGLAQQVTFTGEVPLEDLPGFYQLADVFVFPSREETLPLAVLEAMSKSKPVIAARVGGVPYQIGDDAGILFDAGDVNALAAAIQTLLEQPAACVEMGKAAYRRLINEFTWERAANLAIEGYQELQETPLQTNGHQR
jgi:glycosyltransferase involved in cell wall biosynthesis